MSHLVLIWMGTDDLPVRKAFEMHKVWTASSTLLHSHLEMWWDTLSSWTWAGRCLAKSQAIQKENSKVVTEEDCMILNFKGFKYFKDGQFVLYHLVKRKSEKILATTTFLMTDLHMSSQLHLQCQSFCKSRLYIWKQLWKNLVKMWWSKETYFQAALENTWISVVALFRF